LRRFAITITAGTLSVVFLIAGLVIWNQSSYAVNTVTSQLGAQNIAFTPLLGLTAEQKTHQCLVHNAGKQLVSGEQAECYANYQIALDLKAVANGKTYAQISYPARQLQIHLGAVAAKNPGDPSLPALRDQVAKAEAPVTTMFQGESLRGMLLTTYGFSHMGKLGQQAAVLLFVLAGLSFLAAIGAGIVSLRGRKPIAAAAPTREVQLV
jgi:hypothetical protein